MAIDWMADSQTRDDHLQIWRLGRREGNEVVLMKQDKHSCFLMWIADMKQAAFNDHTIALWNERWI